MSAWFDPEIQPRDWWRALSGRSRVDGDRGVVASVCLLRPLSAPTEAEKAVRWRDALSRGVGCCMTDSDWPLGHRGSTATDAPPPMAPASVGASRRAA